MSCMQIVSSDGALNSRSWSPGPDPSSHANALGTYEMSRSSARLASGSPGRLLPLFSLLDCIESGNRLAGFARELCQRQSSVCWIHKETCCYLLWLRKVSHSKKIKQNLRKREVWRAGLFLCAVNMFSVCLCGFLLAHPHRKTTWALGYCSCQCPSPRRWPTDGGGPLATNNGCPLLLWDDLNSEFIFHFIFEYEWMLQIDYLLHLSSSTFSYILYLLYFSSSPSPRRSFPSSLLLFAPPTFFIFYFFCFPIYFFVFLQYKKSLIYKICKRWNQTDKRMHLLVHSHSGCPLTGRWIIPFQCRRSSFLFAVVVVWAHFSDYFKAGHIIIGTSQKHAVWSCFGLCWFRRPYDWNVRGIWHLSITQNGRNQNKSQLQNAALIDSDAD